MIDRNSSHFFDTDILFFFICSNSEWILFRLYNKLYVPEPVFSEVIKFRGKPGTYFKNKVIYYEADGKIEKIIFNNLNSDEYKLYIQLQSPKNEYKKIGRGESAAISMAKFRSGVIVSSNFSDVEQYAEHYSINHVGTDDILSCALQLKLITLDDLLEIRTKMIEKGGRLPIRYIETYKYV